MASTVYRVYTLNGLLPEGHRLVLNPALGILTQIDEECAFIEQQMLTTEELYMVGDLLDAYPYHARDAALLAAKTQRSLEECEEKVMWAYNTGGGALDAVMRPVRNVLSRCRAKLYPFGVDIKSVLETGYILMAGKKRED